MAGGRPGSAIGHLLVSRQVHGMRGGVRVARNAGVRGGAQSAEGEIPYIIQFRRGMEYNLNHLFFVVYRTPVDVLSEVCCTSAAMDYASSTTTPKV